MKKRKSRALMSNISPSQADFWHQISNLVLIVSSVFVLLGTVGSYMFGVIKERFSDERIRANELETASANKAAALANENTEKLRESNLILQASAERERAARLALEAKIAPRRLLPDQHAALANALSPFQGRKVTIICIMGDAEGKRFAEDFVSAFRAAGWNAGRDAGVDQAVFSQDPVGIIFRINDEDAENRRASPELQVLINSLLDMAIIKEATVFGNANLQKSEIELIVGRKP
ncbi:hypothetical protein KXR53_16540 [Inquilinus limosus]|uniref:hypothetical protein n=1 Tax=Inquilinus limosus TaxID=171674 RepID=UPI003F188985